MKDDPIINWPPSVFMTLALMPNLEVPVITKIWVGGTEALNRFFFFFYSSWKIFVPAKKHYQSVKLFGFRSGATFCRS